MMLAHVTEFSVVMPLSPYFIKEMHISVTLIGLIAGIYMYAACVSSLLFSRIINHFTRKHFIFITLAGLIITSILTGFAWNTASLIVLRIIAGAFGGMLVSLAQTIIAENIPPERRGKAVGTMLSAITVSGCLLLPASTFLSTMIGWRAIFIIIGFGFLILAFYTNTISLPDKRNKNITIPIRHFFRQKYFYLGFAGIAISMGSNFILMPNLANYFVFNEGISMTSLSIFFLVGGLGGIFGSYLGGILADNMPIPRLLLWCTLLLFFTIIFGLIHALLPFILFMILFSFASAVRRTLVSTQNSFIPNEQEKAAYMSLLNAFRNLGAASMASISGVFLSTTPEGHIQGIHSLAYITLGMNVILLIIVYATHQWLQKRKEELKAA